jgi:hypothetical protein
MTVRKHIVLGGLAVLAACTPSSQPPASATAASTPAATSDALTSPLDATTRTGLLAFRDSVWHAWFAGDTAFLRQALPADFLSIPFGDDTTWAGRDETIASSAEYASSGGKMTHLEFPRTDVQVLGNTAIILTSHKMELESGGKRSTYAGRATEIFVRQGGKWSHPSWHLDSGK